MCVYLRTKLQVSSIILTSLKQGGNFPPPQNEPLKSTLRLVLNSSFQKVGPLRKNLAQTNQAFFIAIKTI